MFKIYFVNSAYEKDQVLMYDDTRDDDGLKLGNPKMHIEVNTAGTLDFELPSTNVAYSRIIPMVTELHVIKDNQKTHDKHIWFGRVLTIDTDLYGTKTVHCEGGLAYLNDCIYYDKSVDHGSWSNQKTVGRAIFARYESPTLNEGGVHVYGVSPNEASAVIANIMSGGSNYKENLNAPFKHLGRIAKDTDSDVPIYAWVNEPVVPSGDQTDEDYYFDEDNLNSTGQNQCGISNPNNMTAIDLISSMMSNVGGLFWVSKTPQYPKRTFGGANSGDAVYVMQLHMRRYYPAFNPDEGQTIQLGENLTDLTITDDGTTFFTAVHPHGQHANSGEDFTLDRRGSQGGTTYVNKRNWKIDPEHGVMYCPELVKQYGMIIRDLDVGTSNIYEQLVGMGISEIDRIPIISKTVGGNWTSGVRELTVKGIDLSLYNADYSSIELTDAVRVLAPRHGIDTYLNVTAIDYDLQNVENTVFTLNAIKTSNEITNASPSYGSSSVTQSSGSSYVHPKHTEHDLGLYKFSNDNLGHVDSAVAVTKKDITALGIPDKDTNTTYKLSKDGNTIKMTGSDGTTYTVVDSDTVYTHPKFTEYANGLYKIAVNDEGHVTNAKAVTKKDITALGIPGSIPIYNVDVDEEYGYSEGMIIATIVVNQTAHPIVVPIIGENENADYGLMSESDKKKLDGIADNANNYVHPTTSGNKHIPSGGASGQILRWSADGTAVWGADNNTTYSDATQSTHGLMTAADKKKLDDLAHAESISSIVFKNDSSKTYMGVKFSANLVSSRFLIMENDGRRADIQVSIRIGIDTKAIVYACWNTDTEFRIFHDNEDYIYVIFNCSAWSRGSCISTIENAIMTQWNGTSYPSNLTAIATDIRYTLDSANFTRYAADKNHTHQYVPWIAMGGSGTKALYGIFASLPDTNPTLNQGATLLITDAGNFVSGQTGAWLVQISNRNNKPWMIITTLIPHAAGDVQFGYYHDTENKLFYFGVYTTPYRSTLVVSTLRKDNAVIKNFVNYTSAPSGWTVVNPQYAITEAETLTDSGWVATTRNTSFTATSTVKCRKYGQLVEVRGEVTFNSTYGSPTVCTLPAGYRPATVVQTCGYTPSGKIFGIKVDTAGVVSFSSDAAGTFVKSTTYRIDLTYLLG